MPSPLDPAEVALRDAKAREAATTAILRIINTSRGALEPVLEAIADAATRLCGADHTVIRFRSGPDETDWQSWDPVRGMRKLGQVEIGSAISTAMQTRQAVHLIGRVDDWFADYPFTAAIYRSDGLTEATCLAIPLIGSRGVIGAIATRRHTARAFEPRDLALIEQFAEQAAMAVENAQLIGELQQRNREIHAALEQQAAIAGVLEVIASDPGELDTVLPRLANAAATLCEADDVVVSYGTAGGAGRGCRDSALRRSMACRVRPSTSVFPVAWPS